MSENKNPIRIEIPLETIEILKTDKNRFGASSMNELYNTIINNYVDESPVNMRNLVMLKKSLLEEIKDISESQLRGIIDIAARNSIKDLHLDYPSSVASISIKPTYLAEEGFKTLHQICNIDHFSSMTKALRNLFVSYSKLAVIEREKIICKDELQKLHYAINNRLQLSITHKDKDYTISPYLLVTPADDYSNYLIAKTKENEYKLFRVIHIKINKVIEYSMFQISKKENEVLGKYKKDGVTAFDSETAKLIKKLIDLNDNDEAFSSMINQIRGMSGNEHQIKEK